MADFLPEIQIDTRGEAGIENLDELMAAFPAMAQRAANSALASEGYRLKELLQRAITTGGPDGEKWPQQSFYASRLTKTGQARYRRYKKRATRQKHVISSIPGGYEAKEQPLLKFKGGIRYKMEKGADQMEVGFVNPSAGFAKLLGMAETGFDTPVTRKMRKFFFSLGLPLAKTTTVLKSPARPLIGPVFEAEEATIAENLERKFFANMDRYWKEDA